MDDALTELNPEIYSSIAPTASIAEGVEFEHPVSVYDYVEIKSNVRIGAFTELVTGAAIHRNVSIGRYCSIARYSDVGAGDHPMHFLSTHSFVYKPQLFERHPVYGRIPSSEWEPFLPTTVGNDVWIGAKATIRNGMTVGDGAVIAGGAMVVNDVPAYAVVGGVPARIIRFRYDDQTIARLLDLQWWDLPLEVISKVPFHDVPKCIEILTDYKNSQEE